jgi:hypothetical protein
MPRIALLAFALLCGGCASSLGPRCADGQQVAVSELIYFGAATPDGVVSAESWNVFLRDIVTPRFPQGLTSWEASGQWRSADGSLTREDSHVLNLVHPADSASEGAIRAIVNEYKQRFRQEAVLRVAAPACISL